MVETKHHKPEEVFPGTVVEAKRGKRIVVGDFVQDFVYRVRKFVS